MDNKVSSIKDYAKKAKKRMVSGYWDKVRQDREEYIKNNKNESPQKIRELYSKRLMREIYLCNNMDKDDELYKKVCKLLSKEGNITNPISYLIDHSEYDHLDKDARQIYLLKLTDKYNSLRERYEKERESKIYNIL